MPPSMHELHKAVNVVLTLRDRLVVHFPFSIERLVSALYGDQDGFVDDEVLEFVRHLDSEVVRGETSQFGRRISGIGSRVFHLRGLIASHHNMLQLDAWLDALLHPLIPRET